MPADAIQPLVFRHPVSASTHLLYAVWTLYAAALMWRLSAGQPRHAGMGCFGASLVLLYVVSGLYHAVPADQPRLIEFFRRLDLSLIHILIAATCTPALLLLPDRWRVGMLALVWSVALVGVLSKWLLPSPPNPLTVALYAAAGAVGLPSLVALAPIIGWRALGWLLGGALVYGLGGTCEALRWPVVWPGVIGPHEILHLCDVIGSTMHVVFVLRLATKAMERG
jgi:hemolysin III